MKIGHVSLSYRPVLGGQDTYIENLKKVFLENGHISTVYQALSFRHEIDRQGVHVIRTLPAIGRWIKNFNWYYFNFFLRLFRRFLKKEDLLVVHYAVHYPAVKFHKKVVILSHGIEWHTPADQWDDSLRARRAKETFENCFVVANDTEYLRFCGLDIQPGEKYFEEVAPGKWFIPNCVDLNHFKRVKPDPDLVPWRPILVPRNIYFHRGVHLAVEAFGLLVQEGNVDNHLVVIGKVVDPEYFEQVKELIQKYGIEDRVHFIGHTEWREMPAKYSAGVCTLIPTLDCEGTSLSALESMACGTPVVATRVAGLKDLPCVHAEPNPASIKEALKKVLQEPEVFGRQQCQAVQDTFNLKAWTEAWNRVLKRTSE